MMYVYRVHVTLGSNESRVWVNKDLIRCRIVKMGREYFHLNPWPENYGSLGDVKVPKGDCYTELDEAIREADERANVLIARLVTAVDELKLDSKVLDRTQDINAE